MEVFSTALGTWKLGSHRVMFPLTFPECSFSLSHFMGWGRISCAPHPLLASFTLFTQSGTTNHLQEVQVSGKPVATLILSCRAHIAWSNLEHILFISWGNDSSKAACVQVDELRWEHLAQGTLHGRGHTTSSTEAQGLWDDFPVHLKLNPRL